MKALTKKQENVLKLIAEKVNADGFPPTLQELADKLGVASKNAVLKHLSALEKKGYIGKRESGAARGIRILESMGYLDGPNVSSVPLVGSVPAGSPLLAEENVERYLTVPKELLPSKKGEYFALKVQGDSMIDAGIHEDDLVVVQHTNYANNGDIVVALIGNETTVKRFMSNGEERYLKPENTKYTDIRPTEEWSVQGKVIALIRQSVN